MEIDTTKRYEVKNGKLWRCKSCGVPEYVGKYHQELVDTERGILCHECRRNTPGVPL